MGNNASAGASGGSGGGLYDGRFFAGRRVEFTLANFRQLHAQLLDFERLPASEIVELLRVLSEFLIYSDQHRGRGADAASPNVAGQESYSAASFFDYFGEKNVLALLVEMGTSSPSVPVQIQLLQTLSILVQNIATRTSLYYILSNNYINRLLECPFAVDEHDDVRDWYVTLLKALSLRLNEETVQFFFDSTTARFPLYARALRFGRCQDNMIKVAVKTLTLNVLRVPDERVRSFILHHDGMNYFRDIVDYTNDVALRIQGLLNAWPSDSETPASAALIEKLEEAVDEYIDHCYYLQDILDVNLPELCYKVGEWLYTLHVRALLAASILPDCNPPPQRVSTRLALYLMTRLLGILEHPPLVNAIVFMLLGPDAVDYFDYSTTALGAGSRRQSRRSQSEKDGSDATSGGEDRKSDEKTDSAAFSNDQIHAFRAHSATDCNSPLCYLQTRFGIGEWPVKEVQRFNPGTPDTSNCFRASLLALMQSGDERLSSVTILLLLSIINSSSVDHSLLQELNLLPFRHRRHKRLPSGKANGVDNAAKQDLSDEDEDVVDDDDEDTEEQATMSSASSSGSSSGSGSAGATSELGDASTTDQLPALPSHEQYPHWLVDDVLKVLARNPSNRLVNAQLCVRLILDLVFDPRAETPLRLTPQHVSRLKGLHSGSTHLVMESMRGSMSDVDLFVYVLEDEFAAFYKSGFPVALNLQGSSPFEFLVEASAQDEDDEAKTKATARQLAFKTTTLELREPENEMEVCRKSMRIFLMLRKLRELMDERYRRDRLEKFVAFRHPHTSILSDAAANSTLVRLDGMVTLPCLWREQRFLLSPAKLLMVLNPEAVVFVEKNVKQGEYDPSDDTFGAVRLFAPMHRTYCSVDGKDDRVLHLTVSSAVPVRGCRCDKKAGGTNSSSASDGALKNWHASILFGNGEDCNQAQAHIDLCRAEVRAFKLTQIEESLSTHVQVTPSAGGMGNGHSADLDACFDGENGDGNNDKEDEVVAQEAEDSKSDTVEADDTQE